MYATVMHPRERSSFLRFFYASPLFFLLPEILFSQSLSFSDSLVFIPAGTYFMGDLRGAGSTDERPVHRVAVAGFYLGKYEVTVADYMRFVESTRSNYPAWMEPVNPHHRQTGKKDYYRKLGDALSASCLPVVGISWYNAVAYCNWLSGRHGYLPAYGIEADSVRLLPRADGYRLPSEAEWEYAARQGGRDLLFGNGRDTARAAEINFDARAGGIRSYADTGAYRARPAPAGSFAPNRAGLYDMSGNVWERCQDWYAADAYRSPRPFGPARGDRKVMRGGSWYFDAYSARVCNRHHARPEQHFHNAGFRLARSGLSEK